MKPTAQGRHCTACQHTVIDFTRRTDAEILGLLRVAAGGRVCGRFRAEQLDRELEEAPRSAAPRWRAWLLAVAALGGEAAAAQQSPATHSGGPVPARPVPTTQLPAASTLDPPAAVPDTTQNHKIGKPALVAPGRRITGRVMDQSNSRNLPGATILLKGSTIGTYTQDDGRFVLEGPLTAEAVLQISLIGYASKEVRLLDLNQPILLTEDQHMLSGEVVIAGVPAPWHTPRGLWYRLRSLPRRLAGRW